MRATLWDGNKQLEGELDLNEDKLTFRLLDFELTDLNFEMEYLDIESVRCHRVFEIAEGGIEIISKRGKRNVFVVEDVDGLRRRLVRVLKLKSEK